MGRNPITQPSHVALPHQELLKKTLAATRVQFHIRKNSIEAHITAERGGPSSPLRTQSHVPSQSLAPALELHGQPETQPLIRAQVKQDSPMDTRALTLTQGTDRALLSGSSKVLT